MDFVFLLIAIVLICRWLSLKLFDSFKNVKFPKRTTIINHYHDNRHVTINNFPDEIK